MMLTAKIQRQSSSPVITPPMTTPIPETSSVAAPQRPIAVPRFGAGEDVGEDRHRRRHQQCATDSGKSDPRDQHLDTGRDRRQQRAEREQQRAADEHPAAPEDVGDAPARDQQRRERDVERGHRPLQFLDRGAELGVNRRQRNDDRGRRELNDAGGGDGREQCQRPAHRPFGDFFHGKPVIRASGTYASLGGAILNRPPAEVSLRQYIGGETDSTWS